MGSVYEGRWQVESITHDGTTTPVTVNARATLSADGRLGLYDTVNRTSGRFEDVKGGFVIREAWRTLALYLGDDPVRQLVIVAFKAIPVARRVAASVTEDRLTVTAGEFRIVFTRAR